jgi:hypothetical protein
MNAKQIKINFRHMKEEQINIEIASKLTDKIKVRYIEEDEIDTWTIGEAIDRINEDNYDPEYNYNESDWIEGFIETLEGEFYSLLDKDGKPLNDLSMYDEYNDSRKEFRKKYRAYSLAKGGSTAYTEHMNRQHRH